MRPSNESRAEAAKVALLAHDDEIGNDPEDEAQTRVTDLLANLMHYALQEGVDFERALRTASIHFESEAR